MELSFDLYWEILSYSMSDSNVYNLLRLRRVSTMFKYIVDKLYIPNKEDWKNALKSSSIESIKYLKSQVKEEINTQNDLNFILMCNSTTKKDDIFEFILYDQYIIPDMHTLAKKGSAAQVDTFLKTSRVKPDHIRQISSFVDNVSVDLYFIFLMLFRIFQAR